MAVIHISEEQFASDPSSVLSKARAGEEVVIGDDASALRLGRAVSLTPRDSALAHSGAHAYFVVVIKSSSRPFSAFTLWPSDEAIGPWFSPSPLSFGYRMSSN